MKSMSLIGSQAPDIELYTDEKSSFKLSDHRGSNVVVFFFPAAFSGGCTTELNTVNNDKEAYMGATIIGISTDTPFALAEFRKINALSFNLASDHNATVCASYGAKYDHDFTNMKYDRIARRSAFVIDKDGNVVYEEVLESAGDFPNFDAIKSKLSELS